MSHRKGLGRFAGMGLETIQQAAAASPDAAPETREGEAASTAVVVDAAPTSVVEESPSAVEPATSAVPTSEVENPAIDPATAAAPTTDAENSEVGEQAKAKEEGAAGAEAAASNEDLREDLEGNETLAQVDEEMGAVENDAAAISQTEQDNSIMEDAAQGLEQIALTLEASLEHGGLDNVGVEMMHHAVNANIRKLNLECSPVASMECFSDASRMQATSVSLESMRDWIGRIWKAIKEGLAKLRRMISDFFMKLRTAAPTVEKAALALKARVAKLDKEAKPKTPKFVVQSKYALDKEEGGVIGALKKVGDGMKGINDWISTQKKLSGEIVKVVNAVDVSSEDALIASLAGVHGSTSKSVEKIDLGSGRALEIPVLANSNDPDDLQGIAKVLEETGKIKAEFKIESGKENSAAKAVEIDILTPEGMNGVLDAIIECCQLVAKGADVVSARDDLIKAGDGLEKKVAGEDLSSDAVAALSSLLKLTSSVSESIGKPADHVYLHAMQVSRDLLNVVKVNLDSY